MRSGGFLQIASGAEVTLKNMTITGSDSSDYLLKVAGGGSLRLENVVIQGGETRGGLYVGFDEENASTDGVAVLVNCVVRDCYYTNNNGAAIYANAGALVILDGCSIKDNRSEQGGAGLFLLSAAAYINNTVFYRNTAATGATGGAIQGTGIAHMMNSTVLGNVGGWQDGILFTGDSRLINCVVLDGSNIENEIACASSSEGDTASARTAILGNGDTADTVTNSGVSHTVFPLYEGASALSGGAETYFHYDEYGTNIRMGYQSDGAIQSIAGAPTESDRVTDYLGGATRHAGVIGASGPYDESILENLPATSDDDAESDGAGDSGDMTEGSNGAESGDMAEGSNGADSGDMTEETNGAESGDKTEETNDAETHDDSDGGESGGTAHVHHFVQTMIKEPTAEEDGILAMQCDECGYYTADSVLEVTGYGRFNEDAVAAIRGAAQGATVTLDTRLWISFNHLVAEELAARPDVTLTVNYVYQGEAGSFTIPAGQTDITQYLNDDLGGFVGFAYLASIYAAAPAAG